MAEKQKNAQKARKTKMSAGTARGSKPIPLTPLEKVLLVNGGLGHHLRKGKHRQSAEDMTAYRKRIG
jgi:hypothetical protein